jgi:hypothetical protein
MRKKLVAAALTAVLVLGMNSLPAVAKSGGWSGKGGGWSGKSGGWSGKSGGWSGKSGFSKWSGFHGKGHHGKFGFKHGHKFNNAGFFWGGWPYYIDRPTNLIVRYQDPPAPPPTPVVVAQPKIFAAGTAGGCSVEHVNVPQGTVNVYRC